jgi:NADPH-dependent curcumin reductase CurA
MHEKSTIEGFVNIEKFQNFTSSITSNKTTWISSGKCKQK